MKIAFVSDTHFGFSRFYNDARERGEIAILDACKKAEILLLGGDIFDERRPSIDTLTNVALLLQRAQKMLPESNFPKILGIHGTHELGSKDSINPLAMMAMLGLMEDVHNKTCLIEHKSQNGQTEKIAISGMGGIPDDLVKSAFSKLSCKPIKGATNFFLFHQTLQEYVPQAKNLAAIEDLPAGYDYYLCGHIHSKKEYINSRLFIPGSTVLTQQKDEEQNPKGYFIFDTLSKTREFIEIPVRPFTVIDLHFENASSTQVRLRIEQELLSILSKKWGKAPIIKLRLLGSLEKSSGNLDLSSFNPKDAYLTIDNQLKGSSLLDDLQKLKEGHFSRKSPHELGISLLKENAKKANLDPKKAEEYFERFSAD